jgi:uncharacterized membrane protein YsdA (DUF1294 family)
MNRLLVILAWTLVVGILTFAAYWSDKRRARAGRRRIRERTLHLWSLVGGWPGAFVAQRALRHKTRDMRFLIVYWLTVALHLAGWGLAIWLLVIRQPAP